MGSFKILLAKPKGRILLGGTIQGLNSGKLTCHGNCHVFADKCYMDISLYFGASNLSPKPVKVFLKQPIYIYIYIYIYICIYIYL